MTSHFSLLVVVLAISLPDIALCWEGKVVGVVDGDTIKVMFRGRAEKVRLFGVDCPEEDQDFGTRAKQFTSNMVFGRIVEVVPVDRDQYGRTVAWVTLDGRSLNRELLTSGMAWWYRRYAGQDSELRLLEQEARKKRVGLWSHPNPVPPWKFRRQRTDEAGPDTRLPMDGPEAFVDISLDHILIDSSIKRRISPACCASVNEWKMHGLVQL
jgi:micrococcal nuclease